MKEREKERLKEKEKEREKKKEKEKEKKSEIINKKTNINSNPISIEVKDINKIPNKENINILKEKEIPKDNTNNKNIIKSEIPKEKEKKDKKEIVLEEKKPALTSTTISLQQNPAETPNQIEESKTEPELIIPAAIPSVSIDKKESSETKSLNSDQKLEKKIKDLEEKLDNLNNNNNISSSEQEKQDEVNINNNLINKYELSDITKAFLDSYLDNSDTKAELSDFSKAYMTGLTFDYQSEPKNEERPALSGLTMEFLNDNYDTTNNKMEVIEEKEEENNN